MADGDQPGQPAPAVRLELDAGEGLLSARALWAAIVGPHRLAMATGTSKTLFTSKSTEVAKNIGAANVYVFVGISLPPGAEVSPLTVYLSREPDLGKNASATYLLNGQMGGGGFGPSGFMQLLGPGEQLFAKIAEDLGAPETQKIVVSQVQF
jgi:hypothetical protein